MSLSGFFAIIGLVYAICRDMATRYCYYYGKPPIYFFSLTPPEESKWLVEFDGNMLIYGSEWEARESYNFWGSKERNVAIHELKLSKGQPKQD